MKKIKLISLTGIFTAIVFVFTAYFHIPSHTGYTHIGDAFIYLAACILPLPYGIFVGAVGALLADCLTGFALWAPATIIIKSVSVILFCQNGKIITLKNCLALFASSALCIGGYYLYEAILTGNFIAALAGIPGYVTQSILSSILFIFVGISCDKLKIKHLINGGK